MKIEDIFRRGAEHAANSLDRIADQQEANLAKQQKLHDIRRAYDRFNADGTIDDEEFGALIDLMKREGVDTTALEEMRKNGKPIADTFESTMSDAIHFVDNDYSRVQTRLQIAIADYRHGIESASAIQDSGHRANMTVINNCKA